MRALYAVVFVLSLAGCAGHDTGGPRVQSPGEATVGTAAASIRGSGPNVQAPDQLGLALTAAERRALTIFLGSQSFAYHEDGRLIASGPVSSGTAQHPTPTGGFRVLSKDADKRSGSYTNYFDQPTPMPYALQFHGPYFVHEGWLPGYADSHGCVRLRHEDARFVFERMRVGDPILVTKETQVAVAAGPQSLFPLF